VVSIHWLLALAAAPAVCPQGGSDAIAVHLVEPAAASRELTMPLSLPFARGVLRVADPPATYLTVDLASAADDAADAAGAAADGSPARPLLFWSDGSVALLQAHVRVRTRPAATRTLFASLRRDASGAPVPFAVAAPLAESLAPLPLWTEVTDPWGRVHCAELQPDERAGEGGVVFDSGAVCVRRHRALHRGVDGPAAGAPFLGLIAYETVFARERRAELLLVLDNTAAGEGALGPVRLGAFALVTGTDSLRFLPAFSAEQRLVPPEPRAGGGYRQWLLAPRRDHYLGAGTAKAFRIHLFHDDATVADGEREDAALAGVRPVLVADVDAIRATRAFGAHGGPAPRLGDETATALALHREWRETAALGVYGAAGDVAVAAASGTPRNGESALHNLVRWRSPHLWSAAELMVLQQTLRPLASCRAALPAATAPWRQGMGQLALAAPHGFTPLDYEHFSVLLWFDWYWLTGEPLAREWLVRHGQDLREILRRVPFRTSRGEGWCLQSGALIAWATADRELERILVRRVREELWPALEKAPRHVAIAQPAHPAVLDGLQPFDAPWQMAALVRGLHAVHRLTGDEIAAAAAVRVAETMATASWVHDVGPATWMGLRDATSPFVTADPVEFAGTTRMTIGAFALAAELVDAAAGGGELLRGRAAFLVEREVRGGLEALRNAAANPWLQVAFDRGLAPR
jgi:hypothetical protein